MYAVGPSDRVTQRHMQPLDPPLPTFLIIGAQKSATRWLRVNLGEHPDVFTAEHELSFFNHQQKVRRWGLDWYRRQFVGWAGEPVVGEATPGYMIPRHDPAATAKRIDRNLPEVRLIAVLRNPIDRANSALRHHQRRNRLPKNVKLAKVARKRRTKIRQLGLVDAGLYAEHLRPYHRRFGARLLVVLHDDVVADPQTVYKRALIHIGAEPTFVPPALERVVFSNQPQQASNGGLTLEERREMWPYFQHDVRKLQKMIRRDLSMWNPEWHAVDPEGMASAASGPSAS
jgi:hypothetical protein